MSTQRTEQPSYQQIAPLTDLDQHIVKCTSEAIPQPDPQGVFTPTLHFPEHAKTDQGIDSENKDQGGHKIKPNEGKTPSILKMPNPIKDTVSGKPNKKKNEKRQNSDIQQQLEFSIATLNKLEKKIEELELKNKILSIQNKTSHTLNQNYSTDPVSTTANYPTDGNPVSSPTYHLEDRISALATELLKARINSLEHAHQLSNQLNGLLLANRQYYCFPPQTPTIYPCNYFMPPTTYHIPTPVPQMFAGHPWNHFMSPTSCHIPAAVPQMSAGFPSWLPPPYMPPPPAGFQSGPLQPL
ncbi:hypothetical protein DPMN_032713 [Dreissena polymorpha]|uniref:Uncharacterized protein n=1 Tax=Dreissena polymorpha TaxID=45954 RepID=A0A9D4M590_DREPO|nr:hypothetical protein DPMN_032713 [Dreissena polymorpha]